MDVEFVALRMFRLVPLLSVLLRECFGISVVLELGLLKVCVNSGFVVLMKVVAVLNRYENALIFNSFRTKRS